MTVIQPGSENAVGAKIAESPAINSGAKSLVVSAAATGDKGTLCVARAFRDDVDHAVHGVRAPHRSARAANHFDPFQVF